MASRRAVAALYDIHGNLPALRAVLADIASSDVELIVIGGDIAYGPFPRETVELLQSLGERALFIRGNADREVAGAAACRDDPRGGRADETAERDDSQDEVAEVTRWCRSALASEELRWLGALPETAVVRVEGMGEVLFCHGSPRSDEEIITPATPEPRLEEMLIGVRPRTVVCGHTHMQFERRVAGRRVINAGSVGMPYEGSPGAYWLCLGPEVAHRRTAYDFARAASLIGSSACPRAEDFAADVLRPPERAASIAIFEGRARGSDGGV